MKSMIKQIGVCMVLGLAFTSCGQSTSDTNLSETVVDKTYTVTSVQVQAIITGYLEVKDALVQTDQAATANAATTALSSLPTGDASVSDIKSSLEKIASSTDVEDQRSHFENLSAQVYTMVQSTGANESTLYMQFCPMAFDNKGASWLSAEKQVNNPYFGDVMLHCGKVKATIEPGEKK